MRTDILQYTNIPGVFTLPEESKSHPEQLQLDAAETEIGIYATSPYPFCAETLDQDGINPRFLDPQNQVTNPHKTHMTGIDFAGHVLGELHLVNSRYNREQLPAEFIEDPVATLQKWHFTPVTTLRSDKAIIVYEGSEKVHFGVLIDGLVLSHLGNFGDPTSVVTHRPEVIPSWIGTLTKITILEKELGNGLYSQLERALFIYDRRLTKLTDLEKITKYKSLIHELFAKAIQEAPPKGAYRKNYFKNIEREIGRSLKENTDESWEQFSTALWDKITSLFKTTPFSYSS